MSDNDSILENLQGLKFSGEQGFFDKSRTVRFFIVILFTLVLFSFLHFREVRVETIQLNGIAPSFVVSQVDFTFNDDEATLILRQNAVRDLGKIYYIPQKDVYEHRKEFEDYLLHNKAWHNQFDVSTFESFYQSVNIIERALLKLRLTDVRTLDKLKARQFPIENYQFYSAGALTTDVELPSYIWDNIRKNYFSEEKNEFVGLNLVFDYFKKIRWDLKEDVLGQKQLRKDIQAKVPEKISYVNAGTRIINQGEKVLPRHIAMLQAMKQKLSENRHLWKTPTLIGTFLLTLLCMAVFFVYFQNNHPSLLTSNRKLFLLVTILILTLAFTKFLEFFLFNMTTSLVEFVRYPLFVPFGAILIGSLMSTSIAIFSSAFLSIIAAVALTFDWEGLLLLNLSTAFVVIFSSHSLRHRKEIFILCLKAWLCAVITIIALHLYNNNGINSSIFTDIFASAFFMFLTGVLVIGILPLLETGFSVMTDVTLMEFMDPNNDLLRRLSIEAPGTYQHSVLVGNLAEAAAIAINANGLFCRVAALYHDIGKITTSQYFTENQVEDVNIHQLLTPHESAQVIISHVSEGVALAREAGLPEAIIDIIKEHHGTTLVYYFYCKQVKNLKGARVKVDEREFRYAGPKPRMKESGIIMIADSFEAASRSLDFVNEDSLFELIERLVREKVKDGQLDQCLLTFEELSIVKRALVKTLLAAGHSRVKYPMGDKNSDFNYFEVAT